MQAMNPEQYIKLIRETFSATREEQTGQCLKMHLLLQQAYPQAVGYYNYDHMVTEIDGVLYDIDGIVEKLEPSECMALYDDNDITELFFTFESTFKDKQLLISLAAATRQKYKKHVSKEKN